MTRMDTDSLAEAIDHAIGRELRAQRGRHKFSRDALQAQSGISAKTIQRIEDGDRSPDLRQLTALCAAFGISVKEFVATALKDVDVRHP